MKINILKLTAKSILIVSFSIFTWQCNTEIPNGLPSDPLPEIGPDIAVTPTNQPDTIIPSSDWIKVHAGEYRMGMIGNDTKCPVDALPVHSVEFSHDFAIMRYEVTVAQYRKFVNANKGKVEMPKEPFWNWIDWKGRSRENHPIVSITWKEAQAFAEWVGGRLPTEAEWEYCAKAGANTKYAGSSTIDNVAFYYKEDGSIVDTITVFQQAGKDVVRIGRKARIVGTQKKPGIQATNNWTIYDMSGNVMEWCADWHSSDYYQLSHEGKAPNATFRNDTIAINPKGPNKGTYKIIRGGGWNSTADFCTVYIRLRIAPGTRSDEIGFRIVKDL